MPGRQGRRKIKAGESYTADEDVELEEVEATDGEPADEETPAESEPLDTRDRPTLWPWAPRASEED